MFTNIVVGIICVVVVFAFGCSIYSEFHGDSKKPDSDANADAGKK